MGICWGKTWKCLTDYSCMDWRTFTPTERLPAGPEHWSVWSPTCPFYLISGRGSTPEPQNLVGWGVRMTATKTRLIKDWSQVFCPEARARPPPPHSTPPLLCPSEGSQSPSTAVLATNGPDIAFPTLGGRVVPVQLMRSSSRPNHLVFKTPEDKICFLFLAYKLAKIWAVC